MTNYLNSVESTRVPFHPFEGDIYSNKTLNEDEQFTTVSSSTTNITPKPDPVENTTLQIFARVCFLADGENRSEIEKVITCKDDSKDDSNVSIHSSRTFRPHQRETNFYSDELEHPMHVQNVVRNILYGLANLFLGWRLVGAQKDRRTFEKMQEDLENEEAVWNSIGIWNEKECKLMEHYTNFFQLKMNSIFTKAKVLLKYRQNYEKEAYRKRIIFYGTSMLMLIGKLVNNKALVILGLASSSLTFLFMIKNYTKNSLEESQQRNDLKADVEKMYIAAAKHRVH